MRCRRFKSQTGWWIAGLAVTMRTLNTVRVWQKVSITASLALTQIFRRATNTICSYALNTNWTICVWLNISTNTWSTWFKRTLSTSYWATTIIYTGSIWYFIVACTCCAIKCITDKTLDTIHNITCEAAPINSSNCTIRRWTCKASRRISWAA